MALSVPRYLRGQVVIKITKNWCSVEEKWNFKKVDNVKSPQLTTKCINFHKLIKVDHRLIK